MTNTPDNQVGRRAVLGTAIKATVGAAVLDPLATGGMVCAQPPAPKGTAASGDATKDATSALAPFEFRRRAVGPTDVRIDILFCGVCHSDIHTARNEWLNTVYPCLPGHEIVGVSGRETMHCGPGTSGSARRVATNGRRPDALCLERDVSAAETTALH